MIKGFILTDAVSEIEKFWLGPQYSIIKNYINFPQGHKQRAKVRVSLTKIFTFLKNLKENLHKTYHSV